MAAADPASSTDRTSRKTDELLKETDELIRIFVTSIKTAERNAQ